MWFGFLASCASLVKIINSLYCLLRLNLFQGTLGELAENIRTQARDFGQISR